MDQTRLLSVFLSFFNFFFFLFNIVAGKAKHKGEAENRAPCQLLHPTRKRLLLSLSVSLLVQLCIGENKLFTALRQTFDLCHGLRRMVVPLQYSGRFFLDFVVITSHYNFRRQCRNSNVTCEGIKLLFLEVLKP